MAATEEGPVRADAEDVGVLGDLAGSAAAVRRVLLPTISKARHSNNRSMRCASRSRICSGRFSNCKLHCRRARFEAGPTDLGDLPDWPERVTPHVLRHFCASQLYLGGMDLIAIQQALGHAWVATTMNYIHVHATHVEDAWLAGQQRAASRLKGLGP